MIPDLLSFLMSPRASSDGWFSRGGLWTGGIRTRAGVDVDECSALNYSAVFAATRIICETVSCLPIGFYERLEKNDRQPSPLGVGSLLRVSPNPDMAGVPFREGRVMHQVNWGNGFAEIQRDGMDKPVALWPIHPSRVTPTDSAKKPYRIENEDGPPTFLAARDMLHVPGVFPENGVWGKGVIKFARESIGGAIGTDQFGHNFWGGGGQPNGLLESPGLKTEQQRDEARANWGKMLTGQAGSRIAIMGPNTKYTPISLNNNDSQFLETRRFNRETIATWYRLPAHMLGEKITFANMEQAGIEFVVYSIFPWVRKWEEESNFKLLSPAERIKHYFEHNFAGLLRGDIAARYNAYHLAIMNGFMSINEARRLENMNGIGPAGDQFYMPLNMTTVERMASGDAPPTASGLGSDQSGSPAGTVQRGGLLVKADLDQMTRALATRSDHAELQTQLRGLEAQLEDRKVDYGRLARMTLLEVLDRILTKESRAALKASDKREFDVWVREFYPQHEVTIAAWLEPACLALQLAGVAKWASSIDLAAWLRARNAEAVQAAYSRDTRETFARRLEAWPSDRAKMLVEEIMAA